MLWKLGPAPDKSFNGMLSDMMVDRYYNFKERSKVDPDTAQRWGALAVKLTDRLERLDKETGVFAASGVWGMNTVYEAIKAGNWEQP